MRYTAVMSETLHGSTHNERKTVSGHLPEALLASVETAPSTDDDGGLVSVPLTAGHGHGGEEHAPHGEKKKPMYPGFLAGTMKFRRKVFSLVGGEYRATDENDQEIFYARQRPFRLREDFRVYPNKKSDREVLKIKTPRIVDAWATFTVEDPAEHQPVGSLRRKWFDSIFRDTWEIRNSGGQTVGSIREKSQWGAIVSRFLPQFLAPQNYSIRDKDGHAVADIRQSRNPFVLKYDMNIHGIEPSIDRRLLAASGILLAGIERRQEKWSISFDSDASATS